MNPRFSVVIPCYNADKYIAGALQSVARQSRPADQVIVVDDGSTDSSLTRIERSEVPLELLHTNRRGGAGARNAGIAAATGDWIAFLDADDEWYPNHLERAGELIASAGDSVVGLLNWFDHLAPTGDAIVTRPCLWPFERPVSGMTEADFFRIYARVQSFVGMSACSVRRDAALRVGGLSEQMIRRHDIEFWLRLLKGNTWAFDPIASSAYRTNVPGSISRNVAESGYYRLAAFVRNEDAYSENPDFRRIISRAAESAMAGALTDGSSGDIARTWDLAESRLPRASRMLFRFFNYQPAMFRLMNKARRRLRRPGPPDVLTRAENTT